MFLFVVVTSGVWPLFLQRGVWVRDQMMSATLSQCSYCRRSGGRTLCVYLLLTGVEDVHNVCACLKFGRLTVDIVHYTNLLAYSLTCLSSGVEGGHYVCRCCRQEWRAGVTSSTWCVRVIRWCLLRRMRTRAHSGSKPSTEPLASHTSQCLRPPSLHDSVTLNSARRKEVSLPMYISVIHCRVTLSSARRKEVCVCIRFKRLNLCKKRPEWTELPAQLRYLSKCAKPLS